MRQVFLGLIFISYLHAQTAVFPNGVATDQNLGVAGNQVTGSLYNTQQVSDTILNIRNGTCTSNGSAAQCNLAFKPFMFVSLDAEIEQICSITTSGLFTTLNLGIAGSACPSVNGRGLDGSAIAAHNNLNSKVNNNIVAWNNNSKNKEIEAIESAVTNRFSPLSYGATGNGITDDTAALRQTITTLCNAGGGTLILPATYTFTINPTVRANPILNSCSNMVVDIEGTLKIGNNAGSYLSIWGSSGTVLSNFILTGNGIINMNSTNNPLITNDTGPYPRMVLQTGGGSSNNSVIGPLRVTDVRCEWTFFMSGINETVKGITIDNVGGGTMNADSSLIYFSNAAANGLIADNRVVASARNANFAVTAIETHASVVISNNTITDMEIGMNVVGASPGTTFGVTITGNQIKGALIGIDLWSNSGEGATGTGMSNASVTNNNVTINWLSYGSNGSSAGGIGLDPTSNLPFRNISINSNIITFDLSTSAGDPSGTSSAGIGYWDANGGGGCFNCNFSNNTVINAPLFGLRFSAGGSNISFDNETIINPGSILNTSAIGAYKTGLFVATSASFTGFVSVKGGTYTDNNPTSRWGYGVEFLGSPGNNIADGVTINCVDATCASLQNSIYSDATSNAYIRATVNASSAGNQFPYTNFKPQSQFYSIRDTMTYTWSGSGWVPTTNHTRPFTVGADCGSGVNIAGTDTNGFFQIMNPTAITSCTLTFGTPFPASKTIIPVWSVIYGQPTIISVTATATYIQFQGTLGAYQEFSWFIP